MSKDPGKKHLPGLPSLRTMTLMALTYKEEPDKNVRHFVTLERRTVEKVLRRAAVQRVRN